MKRILWISVLSLGALWLLSACSAQQPAATAALPATASRVDSTAPTTGPVALSTAAPAQDSGGSQSAPTSGATALASTSTAPGNTTAISGPTPTVNADLPILKTGALKSYVAQIQIQDESTGTVTGTVTTPTPAPPVAMEMRYRAEPSPEAYSWTITGQHAGQDTGQPSSMIMIGGNLYTLVPGQNKWVQMPSSSPQSLPMKEDILDPNKLAQVAPAGLFSAENVISRHETVDGVDTTHYRANPSQLQELLKGAEDQNRMPVSGQADFWVANDNGYLKQYIMVANLKDSQGHDSRQTVQFTLSKENQPVDIATPAPDQIMPLSDMMPSLVGTGQAPKAAVTPEATP